MSTIIFQFHSKDFKNDKEMLDMIEDVIHQYREPETKAFLKEPKVKDFLFCNGGLTVRIHNNDFYEHQQTIYY